MKYTLLVLSSLTLETPAGPAAALDGWPCSLWVLRVTWEARYINDLERTCKCRQAARHNRHSIAARSLSYARDSRQGQQSLSVVGQPAGSTLVGAKR